MILILYFSFRDIIVQGQKALEVAERARKEQIALACIKRESIHKASQLYIKHLEAAIRLDPPDALRDMLKNLAMQVENKTASLEEQSTNTDDELARNLQSGKGDFTISAIHQ